MNSPLAIELRNVRKIYTSSRLQPLVALNGLDLEVREGQVFGFIGPNGAGKTTAIKIMTGLARPSSGEARIFGCTAGTVAASSLLGYLPEIASYHDFMGVGELLRVHARLAGVPSARQAQACSDALEAVGLADRARSQLKELSKGMQQRFGMAQALVGGPRLLILDEPTSGLDPLRQKEIKDIILGLKQRGITIFFSSHKLTEVEHICDVVGILHQGHLLRCSTLDELLATDDDVSIALRCEDVARVALEAAGHVLVGLGDRWLLRVPQSGVAEALRAALERGATVESVSPQRLTLEEAFFRLVTAKEQP